MSTNAYDAYRNAGIGTADPITLTTMLYDGALKAMKKARIYFSDGNRERFLDETQRAHLIIGELMATLDHEKGGELADQMSEIYARSIRCLVSATLGDLAQLTEAEKHIDNIATAWKQATIAMRQEPRRIAQGAVA
ncbi:MAG: flagellar export chaperone FliS [Dehalococcoidia bacterium]|nr:flagellar export chaperone FliS [Dehalococcoidia bacterium]